MKVCGKSQSWTACGRRCRQWAWSLVWLVFVTGCGSQAYQSAPVNEERARDVLVEVLDAWKNGDTPESLQESETPITVQDFDWMGGARLVSYEVLPGEEPVDANLVAKVKLVMQKGDGKDVEKTVTYLVTTAPQLTVFRDAFR